MHIKLDENLPAELADDLRRLGHLVGTAIEGRQPLRRRLLVSCLKNVSSKKSIH